MTPEEIRLLGNSIRDNYLGGSVGDFIRETVRDQANLSFVSAYFTINAYEALKANLDQITSLRFLFGEPRFIQQVNDPTDLKEFRITENGLALSNQLSQRRIARECSDWMRTKVDIRSIREANLLHGKMYHVDNSGIEEAVIGSSNFTVSGLGLANTGNNIELNLVVDSNRDRKDLKTWFEKIWHDEKLTVDVKDEVLTYLSQLYADNSPEFIYFKTLYHIFARFLDEQEEGGLSDIQKQVVDTEIWRALFEFQKDGVKGAINKIQNYNGCILADSVGLGKTYEALAIIKYFEFRNERVLVLCPKKLKENWTVFLAQNNSELNPFLNDKFNYTVLSHTDLSRDGGNADGVRLETLNWGNYDLVVIDEAHNFRNDTPSKYENGQLIRKSRYRKLMEDILQSGVKTKVLMLSATPVNNDLKDLRNLIYFITADKDTNLMDSLGIPSIKETLRAAQLSFNTWAKKSQDRKTSELLDNLSSTFFKLLDGLTIARSRKHVQRFYKDTIAELGGFPERKKPHSVYPEIDTKGEFMSYDKLNEEIENYQLSLFNPSKYVKKEYRSIYENAQIKQFTQFNRENFLIGMMKVNFLKRLESSIHSFDLTLERTVAKIDELRDRINRFKQLQEENPNLDFENLEIIDTDDDELHEAFEVSKARFKMSHLDLDRWLMDLKTDRDQLHILELSSSEISVARDAKLLKLKKLIQDKVKDPTLDKRGNLNKKVLVFTAFSDTAAYLYDAIRVWAREELGIHVALVTGSSGGTKATLGREEFNNILINFSPISKQRSKMKSMPQDEEIDLVIATDCISEGQNLQDCDYLVNFDIHWNPVRVIQRFGRIDRIGSIHNTIQLVNFWPTKDLDKYITLKSRVEARMALVDLAATADDNLLNTEEIEDLIKDDLKYRDRQLKRLKEEVLDLEDFTETVALTDFTLDDFRAELSRYIEANRKLLEDAPPGLCGVVPADNRYEVIKPGVIYCLKQITTGTKSSTVNPIQPFFLVYILEDGVVRFGFTHPKQILEIFRTLCSGKTEPFEELCRVFDQDTDNGLDMSSYNSLLDKAVKSIEKTFQKRVTTSLLTDRGAVIPDRKEQITDKTDFELITWLVIR